MDARRSECAKRDLVCNDLPDALEMEDTGADDSMGKKFTTEHLAARVRRLVKMHPGEE
jgi:DNA-binding response OmpR family regulator